MLTDIAEEQIRPEFSYFSFYRPFRPNFFEIEKQVAQRATIAHLTTSHQNTLNSSQVKDLKIF